MKHQNLEATVGLKWEKQMSEATSDIWHSVGWMSYQDVKAGNSNISDIQPFLAERFRKSGPLHVDIQTKTELNKTWHLRYFADYVKPN